MIWFTWRQQRVTLLIGLVLTLIVTGFLLVIGNQLQQDVGALNNPACFHIDNCLDLFAAHDDHLIHFHNASIALLVLPALIGIFIGVPLVAGEYEQRTFLFAWTQGVTRGRWLAIQVAVLFGLVLTVTGLLGMVVNWGESTIFAITVAPLTDTEERFGLWGFDLSGIVPLAYASFALALGLASGALLRRVLPAIALTMILFLGVRVGVGVWWRPYYQPPITAILDLTGNGEASKVTGGFSWRLEQGYVFQGQRHVGGIPVPSDCTSNSAPGDPIAQCLKDHGWSAYITYQPYERFWTFQGIEAAIFLVITAGLLAATFALVTRRQ